MIIELTIFIILLLIQLLLAVFAFVVRKDLYKTYAFPLSDAIDVALTLEKYSRIIRKANLRVNPNIDLPAYAQENYVMINRNKVYLTDLFTNFFVIFQLELSQNIHKFKRNIFLYQSLLFLLQIIVFIVSLITSFESNYIIWSALAIQMCTIILSLIGFKGYNKVLNRTYDISADLLNLDEVEKARAEALKHDLRYVVFEYPVDFLAKLLRFLLP